MTLSSADHFDGPVLVPGDAGYETEIAPFNTAIQHHPDIVVGAASAGDVVGAVRLAQQKGLHITVQATGHGAHTPIDAGILISTRRLSDVRIDGTTHTATIGAGARWDSVVAAASEHGLAPIAGSSTNVGVVGYLLGGGLGPLARSHGFSSDYILGLTVVTGCGVMLEASPAQNADLFWALRGGKTGLGIVTELRLRLVPLRTLYAGSLVFEEQHIETALRAWIEWTRNAHPLVTTSGAIVRYPPLDVIPAPLRGRRLFTLRFAYPSATYMGARLAAPLRDIAPVYIDAIREMSAADIARIHNDPTEPGPAWAGGMLLDRVDQTFATHLLRYIGPGASGPFLAMDLRHLGEATHRDVDEGSAVGGRSATFVFGFVSRDTTSFDTVLPATVDRMSDELAPWLCSETNINFMGKPRSKEHLARACPPHAREKLSQVRREHDPEGRFAHGA